MTYWTRALTTLVMALLALPATAMARSVTVLVPPGDSAASQYVETIPTDRGGGVASPGATGSGGTEGVLTAAQSNNLNRLGPDGRLLVAVVQATSPPPAVATAGTGAGRPNLGGQPRAGTAAGGSSGPGTATPASGALRGSPGALSGVGAPSAAGLMVDAATGAGSGGLGIFLPLLLLASALGVIVHATRRWRARAS